MNVSEALSYFAAEIIRASGRYQQSNQAIDCVMDAAHQGHQISGDANESRYYTPKRKKKLLETHIQVQREKERKRDETRKTPQTHRQTDVTLNAQSTEILQLKSTKEAIRQLFDNETESGRINSRQ